MHSIHLSAENFIKALQGKVVLDENGKQHKFLYKRLLLDKTEYGNVVVIDQRVIVSEEVIIKEDKLFGKKLIFQHPILIQGGEFQQRFSIKGGEFQQWFFILGGEFQDSFRISGGEFQGWFRIDGGEFQDSFLISGGDFQSLFLISGGDFQSSFRISGGDFQSLFLISGGDLKTLELLNKDSIINQLVFDNKELLTCKIIIQAGSKINQIIFRVGIASSGVVYINSVAVQQFIFEDFANEGVLEITQVQGMSYIKNTLPAPFRDLERPTPVHLFKKQLLLLRSNFDNVVFKGVDFTSFDQIVIEDSKVNAISTVRSHFPIAENRLGNLLTEDQQLKQDANEMSEVYHQLYLAMQKQGNRKWELDYYAEYLSWEQKSTKKWGDKFPLALHYWSTNYGRRWYQALWWVMGLGIILYFGYCWSLGGVEVGVRYLSWKSFWFHLNHYFQFLFPIRKFGFIEYTHLTPLATLLDILWRIAQGYLIYQMIAAFRRFGRK
ncbi:hypothetical protein BKI52_12545 [marine bacterium AO1-C]|nr:hypothetical protein BKI52_12545 [marine bacterium AO1-C]